ncbi:hypothetical protein PO909_003121 [Leuciscus waleckii]
MSSACMHWQRQREIRASLGSSCQFSCPSHEKGNECLVQPQKCVSVCVEERQRQTPTSSSHLEVIATPITKACVLVHCHPK